MFPRHLSVAALAVVTVGPVGLLEQCAFPTACLVQQLVPGDRAVVAGIEPAIRNVMPYRILEFVDLARVEREPGDGREVCLRDRERHVHALGVAPLSNDVAAVENDAVHPARSFRRADRLWVGFARRVVAATLVELTLCVGDCSSEFLRVEAGVLRCTSLPVVESPGVVVRFGGGGGGGDRSGLAEERLTGENPESGRERCVRSVHGLLLIPSMDSGVG